jgi:hypothetical protein
MNQFQNPGPGASEAPETRKPVYKFCQRSRSRLVIDSDRLKKLLADCKQLEAEIELSLNRLKSAR